MNVQKKKKKIEKTSTKTVYASERLGAVQMIVIATQRYLRDFRVFRIKRTVIIIIPCMTYSLNCIAAVSVEDKIM